MGQCSVDQSKTTLAASDIYRGHTRLNPGQQGFCSACESPVWWMRPARTHAPPTTERSEEKRRRLCSSWALLADIDPTAAWIHTPAAGSSIDRIVGDGRNTTEKDAHSSLCPFSDPLGVWAMRLPAAPKETGPLCARRRRKHSDLDRFCSACACVPRRRCALSRPTGPKTHKPGPYRSTLIERTRSGGRCFDRTRPAEAPSIESDDDRARPRSRPIAYLHAGFAADALLCIAPDIGLNRPLTNRLCTRHIH